MARVLYVTEDATNGHPTGCMLSALEHGATGAANPAAAASGAPIGADESPGVEAGRRFKRQLLDSIGEAVVALDLTGTILYWNRAAETIYGWKAGEVLGRKGSEILTPPAMREKGAEIMARLRAGESWAGEFMVMRRDGSLFPAYVTDTPVYDEHGAMVALVGVSTDITERKQTETALRESEQLFRQFAENTSQVFWMMDPAQHRILYISPLYEEFWGRTCASLYAEPLSFIDAILPEDRAAFDYKFSGQASGVLDADYRIRRPNGEIRWIHDRGFPVLNEAGEIYRIAGFAEDITERKRMEEALRESQTHLRALAARLTSAREEEACRISRELHDEMGQVLTGLKMETQVLREGLRDFRDGTTAVAMHQRIDLMMRSFDETMEMVRRICSELRPAVLDRLGLVAALEWQAQEFEARTGIFCNLSLPEADPQLDGSRATAVFRIFQEVLTNILQHADASEVSVKFEAAGGTAVLEVCDNGRGMPESTEAKESRGLGIIGMRERALAVNGTLEIRSARGQGTTLVLRIPMNERTASGEPDTQEPREEMTNDE